MQRIVTLLLLIAASSAWAQPATVAPGDGFEVERYAVVLRPDQATTFVSGTETIVVRATSNRVAELSFTANALRISEATVHGTPVQVSQGKDAIIFTLPRPLRKGGKATLRFRFAGTPARGRFGAGPAEDLAGLIANGSVPEPTHALSHEADLMAAENVRPARGKPHIVQPDQCPAVGGFVIEDRLFALHPLKNGVLIVCIEIGIHQAASALSEDPGEPLTRELEALTGLSDAQLRGERFHEETIMHQLDDF